MSSTPTMPNMVEKAHKELNEYVSTYDQQPLYKEYNARIYLNDMLYGIAISMNPDYKHADRYNEFKKDLAKFLNGEIHE